jgi:hypothetical protein
MTINKILSVKVHRKVNMLIKPLWLILILLLVLLIHRCIFHYVPEIHEDEKLLVVEGLITDLEKTNIKTVKEMHCMDYR